MWLRELLAECVGKALFLVGKNLLAMDSSTAIGVKRFGLFDDPGL